MAAAMPTAGTCAGSTAARTNTDACPAPVDVTDTSTMNSRAADTSAMNSDATATATLPAMPAVTTAPSQTATVRITAPVEARAMPARVIPAVVPAAEYELGLLDVAGYRRSRSTRRQRRGGAGENGCAQRKRNGKNKFLH